jgi:hypothetical protein
MAGLGWYFEHGFGVHVLKDQDIRLVVSDHFFNLSQGPGILVIVKDFFAIENQLVAPSMTA